MWICSKCEAKVEPSFDVCWRCGTSYQGEEDPDFVTADESPPIDDPTDYLRLDAGKPTDPELADPPLDLAPCFESNDLAEAQFVADRLIGEGVPATLQNAFNVGIPEGHLLALPLHGRGPRRRPAPRETLGPGVPGATEGERPAPGLNGRLPRIPDLSRL